MIANGVPFAGGAVPMMWAPRSANSGARADTTRSCRANRRAGQFIGSVGFLTIARWRGWHAAAASGRFSIGPLVQVAERGSSRGASCSTTAPPTEMRHDIVLPNKACGDTCACADHGGDRLVCAEPAAILHPALRHVGDARGALLLKPPRPPTSGWIAKSPVTPGSPVCDPDEQKSGRCVMWLTEGFQPPA
jgi:hypothetical protein